MRTPKKRNSKIWWTGRDLNPRPPPCEVDWDSFREWLFRRYRWRTARDRFRYCLRFHECLLRGDFTALLEMSGDKRVHVMKALSSLSKFLGVYDYFRFLVRNYGLKWTNGGGDDLIIARLTRTVDEDVLKWVRNVKNMVSDYAAFMDFLVVTGLRYEEAVNSWNLIIRLSRENGLGQYYRVENEILEHFRFKSLFIRRSKKVFISFVPRNLVVRIAAFKPLTVNVLPERIKRRGLRRRFGDVREFWASYMTKYLRQPEIDFLQGRVSTSVFMRHYFNPVWISDLKERTFKGIRVMLRELEG